MGWKRIESLGVNVVAKVDILSCDDDAVLVPAGTMGIVVAVHKGYWPDVIWDNGARSEANDTECDLLDISPSNRTNTPDGLSS